MTGDDLLTARYMRKEFFEFKQTQKHILPGNSKPRLGGADDEMAKRMVLVPYNAEFDAAQCDELIPQKLLVEAPAILG